MAKKASGKQTTLNSFFKGGKAAEPEDAPASDAEMDVDVDVDVDDVEVEVEAEATSKKDGKIAPDDSSLPPISDIPAIFSDIVRRIPDILEIAKLVKGRKLRIATMCSGTESPLLAFGLIQKAIREQHGIELDMEHVFSCEIVPFKQAYIERNFSPPLLFRDVCELGNDYACVHPPYFVSVAKLILSQPYSIRFSRACTRGCRYSRRRNFLCGLLESEQREEGHRRRRRVWPYIPRYAQMGGKTSTAHRHPRERLLCTLAERRAEVREDQLQR